MGAWKEGEHFTVTDSTLSLTRTPVGLSVCLSDEGRADAQGTRPSGSQSILATLTGLFLTASPPSLLSLQDLPSLKKGVGRDE